MRLPAALWIILAGFLVLTGLFNAATPYRQPGNIVYQRTQGPDIGAPDELQHANYVAHLLQEKSFPVLDATQPDFGENYQSHQPPLYYILTAAWSTLTGTDPQDENAGFLVRFLNSLIGGATLVGIFYCARWGLGRDDIGLVASAFFAFIPMNVALHGAVTNDPLLFCFLTWNLALAAKGVQQGWSMKLALALGVLGGLGILTKTTALAALPVIAAALFTSYKFNEDSKKPDLKIAVICLTLPILVALPWLLRNQNLYGDPFALQAFNESFTGNPKAAMFIAELGPWTYWSDFVGWWTSRSFIGVFGYMDIFLFERLGAEKSASIYLALILIVFGLIAFGMAPLKQAKEYNEHHELPDPRKYHILGATLIVVVTALFIRFNLTYFQGQARYLYPAVAPIAVLFGIGVTNIGLVRSQNVRALNLMNAWIPPAVFLIVLTLVSYVQIQEAFPLRMQP